MFPPLSELQMPPSLFVCMLTCAQMHKCIQAILGSICKPAQSIWLFMCRYFRFPLGRAKRVQSSRHLLHLSEALGTSPGPNWSGSCAQGPVRCPSVTSVSLCYWKGCFVKGKHFCFSKVLGSKGCLLFC